MLLALYLFMADAMRVAGRGVEAVSNLLPTRFDWRLFSLALLLMAAPILDLFRSRCSTEAPRLGGQAPLPVYTKESEQDVQSP